MSNPKEIYGWAYARFLRLYPKEFRAEFGDEMRSVFNAAIRDRSGPQSMLYFLLELRDLPGSLLEAYAAGWRIGGNMPMNRETISPSTRRQAFLGVLPFLAFGVASMIGKVDAAYHLQGYHAEMVVYALVLVGLLVGWIRGFPLWSYSYLGWSLVLAWSNTNVKIHGEKYGYHIWIPFAATVLTALLWTRSLQPIRKLLGDIWKDWTRLSLTMYALGAWVFLIYDENHHPQLLAFMLASTLATAGAAWFFLRSAKMRGRTLAILAGFIITIVINGICEATWDWHAYYGIPKQPTTWYKRAGGAAMMLLLWGIILFWPSIVELIRRKATRQTG
jgi:hypothetical protein